MTRRPSAPRRAFTLMEMLIAIALFSVLLATSVAVLFQVSVAWSQQADDPVLDRHTENLDRFLRRIIAEKGASAPTDAQRAEENALLALTLPPDLPWIDPLVTDSGEIEARLAHHDDGTLWLCWNTSAERKKNPQLKARATRISDWVASATLLDYDAKNDAWVPVFDPESDPAAPASTGAAKSSGATATDSANPAGSATPTPSLRILRLELLHRAQRRVLAIPVAPAQPAA